MTALDHSRVGEGVEHGLPPPEMALRGCRWEVALQWEMGTQEPGLASRVCDSVSYTWNHMIRGLC